MSRALNPQASTPIAGDGRKTGSPATADSINALADRLAHLAGRIVPIYSMRPTGHEVSETYGVDVGGWTVPNLPTHGHWRLEAEEDFDGVSMGAFIGPVLPQFGPSFCLRLVGNVQNPHALGDGLVAPLPIDLDVEWDDTSSTASEAETVAPLVETRRTPPPDPGDILDAHALASRYGDVGPYNLTCRDAQDVRTLGGGVSTPFAVQTGETDAEATDPASHIVADLSSGDLGDSEADARLYIGSMLAHGINADTADTSPETSTGWTVIPDVCPFTQRFGGGHPRSGQALTQVARDLIHLERTVYAARGQVLVAHARSSDTAQDPSAAYKTTSTTDWISAVRGAYFRLPSDALPGSANVTGTGSSTTLALRGGLRCRVIVQDAKVKIGVRKVTIAGSYGQSTTFGAWNFATASDSSGAWVADDVTDDATSVADHVLLPSGIAPGDDIEIGIWWRATSNPGYLRAWVAWEPPLSTVE